MLNDFIDTALGTKEAQAIAKAVKEKKAWTCQTVGGHTPFMTENVRITAG